MEGDVRFQMRSFFWVVPMIVFLFLEHLSRQSFCPHVVWSHNAMQKLYVHTPPQWCMTPFPQGYFSVYGLIINKNLYEIMLLIYALYVGPTPPPGRRRQQQQPKTNELSNAITGFCRWVPSPAVFWYFYRLTQVLTPPPCALAVITLLPSWWVGDWVTNIG